MTIPERAFSRGWSLVALAGLFLITAGILYGYYSDSRTRVYEARTLRHHGTRIMTGAEPRDLGPVDSPNAMLFVHGFIGTPNNYNDLPDRVAEAGWRVRVMLVPGHGTFPSEFEKTSADDMIAGVKKELNALRKDREKIVICGHSMGGALAAIVAAEEKVDGVVFASPFFGLTTESMLGISTENWISLCSPFVRWVPSSEHPPIYDASNFEKVLSYKWVPVRAAAECMKLGRRANTEYVRMRLNEPMLLIHSRKDRVTSSEASERVFETFPSTDKRTVILDKSDHVIFWDYDREAVITETLAFLDHVLEPKAAERVAQAN